MLNNKTGRKAPFGVLELAIASAIGLGFSASTKAALTSYVDFATTSGSRGFNTNTNYTPNSTPTSTTFVDVNGADSTSTVVAVYNSVLTSAANQAVNMGALVFDSIGTNTSYMLRSQALASTSSSTTELDATLTLSGGNGGTAAGTTLNGATTVSVPQTAANDLLVLTSNLGGKTITLSGWGANDSAVLAGGSGNTSVAGINGDNLIIAIPNAGNFNVATGNTLDFNSTKITATAGSKTYTATLSGAGAVTITGGGIVKLNNANTGFSGGFNVSAGSTLSVPGATGTALGATPTTTATRQLTLNGGTYAITSTSGTTPLSVARQIALTAGSVINAISQSTGFTAIAGQISGGGSLLKNGAGTIALDNANNSYTGPTEVSTGALLVDGSIASSSVVTVDGGATLGGFGTTAAVNTSNGSIISPGDPNSYTSSSSTGFTATVGNNTASAIGTLTVGGLKMVAGSIYDYDMTTPGGLGDILISTGAVTGDGGVFNLYQSGTSTPIDTAGTYDLISQTGGYTGGLTSLTVGDLPSDLTANFGIDSSNGDLDVTYSAVVVPEPTALAAIGLGALLLCRRRKILRK